ncbi:MAG: flagellar brake protein [Zoogloeaceae bacterium]|jgi:c-di-GMP-binding flagellar brake protein YcgR|nr:flagellar brake protein [Zoogloeaceae bacterium]
MTEPEKSTVHLELEEANTYDQYLLHSPTEISAVLCNAMKQGCMVSVYFDMGRAFFLTSLLEVTIRGVVLDYGSDEGINHQALQTKRLICTMSVDRVKVQFGLSGVRLVQFEGRPAFASALPEQLLRLQRREYFRVSTPIIKPLHCELPMPAPEGEERSVLQLSLLDISAGGLALMINVEQTRLFTHNQIFHDCLLPLPDEQTIRLSLRICNLFEITNRAGNRYARVGCEYLDLAGTPLNQIQRYITRLERERKARENGLE